MKSRNNGEVVSCGWGYRHELLGVVLVVLATILTLFTGNSLGIFGMFLVGLALFCRKGWHCNCPCHGQEHAHSNDHCHSLVEDFHLEKAPKPARKTRVKKVKA